jgi:hypothetical protein
MNNALWLAAALCLGVSLTPWGPLLLYPFTLFTTWIHECGHAVMAVLVGGSVTSITIQPDTSGLTRSLMPAGRIARGLVASVRLSRRERRRLPAHGGDACRAAGPPDSVGHRRVHAPHRRDLDPQPVRRARRARVGIRPAAAGPQGERGAPRFILSVLAIQVALNAVYDIRVLFLVHGRSGLPRRWRTCFVAPAWLWA